MPIIKTAIAIIHPLYLVIASKAAIFNSVNINSNPTIVTKIAVNFAVSSSFH